MRQQGLPWRDGEVMDKHDAIQRILDSSDSSRYHESLQCLLPHCKVSWSDTLRPAYPDACLKYRCTL